MGGNKEFRFFESLDDIDSKREYLEEHYSDRWDVQEDSVDFLNGLSSAENCRTVDRDDEETNHRTHWKELESHIMTYTSIFSSTKRIARIVLDGGEGEASKDQLNSARVTEIINKNIFHYGTEFHTFLRQFGGEELATGYITTIREGNKIYPTITRHLLLPPNTRVDGKGIQYWIQPIKLTMQDLMNYQEGDEEDKDDGKGGYINKRGIRNLLDDIQRDIQSNLYTTTEDNEIHHKWKDIDKAESKQAYWYFEVQDDGTVNKTLYIRTSCLSKDNHSAKEAKNIVTKIIERKGCAKRASDIIKIYPIGMLIGKEPIIDNCIGTMELIINQAIESNTMKNKLYDLMSFNATPRLFYEEGGRDEALKTDLNEQTVLSNKINFGNNSQKVSVQDAIQMGAVLDQETANFTGSAFSNTGRDQALSSQYKDIVSQKSQFKSALTSYRMKLLDILLADIVYHVLKNKPKGKCDGYLSSDKEGLVAVHSCLKKENIDIEKYLERCGGRTKMIEVSCDRTLSPADDESLSKQRGYLEQRLKSLSGEARNYVLSKFDSAILGPDISEAINNINGVLDDDITKQRAVARREIQTIKDYSMIDQIYPIADSDADETHLEEILLSIQASLIRGANGDWGNVRQIETSAKIAHGFLHLDRLAEQRAESPEIVQSFAQKLEESKQQLESFKEKLNEGSQDGEPTDAQLKVMSLANKKEVDDAKIQLEAMKLQQKKEQEQRLLKGQQEKKEQTDRKLAQSAILGAGQVENQRMGMEKSREK